MLANRLKSQRITLGCVAFLMLNEVNTNHFALVAKIARQPRKRHLDKLLVVPAAHVGFLFPSGIVAYSQRANLLFYKYVNNLAADLVEHVLKVAVSLVVHTLDSVSASLHALPILDGLQACKVLVEIVVVGFEITTIEDDATVGSHHRSEVVDAEVDGSALTLVNVCLPDFLFIDNLNLDVLPVRNKPHLIELGDIRIILLSLWYADAQVLRQAYLAILDGC